MCGQAGLILGRKRRSEAEVAILKTVFSGLLMHNEARGRHASGLAVIDRDGEYRLCKRPIPATQLVAQPEFANVLGALEGRFGRFAGRTTLILGHTRYRTRGCESNSLNNHPLRAADWIGTAYVQAVNMRTRAADRRLLLAFRPAALHIISSPNSIDST